MFEKKLSEESLEQEQSITPSEFSSEKNIETPSIPEEKHTSKRIWLWFAGAIAFLLFVSFILFRMFNNYLDNKRFYTPPRKESVTHEVSNSEGILQINEEESLLFSSGAILKLENNILSFLYNADVPWQEALSFDSKLTAYVNGHLHSFEDVVCDEEGRWFGDYSSSVVTQCRMQYSVTTSTRPVLSSYNGESVYFTSVKNKNVSRFSTLQEEPWIAVSVPYFQIVERMDGSVMNPVSPREDVVRIYTNYGRADFQFEADELKNKKIKTIEKGPLSISLMPQELICEANNISAGSCYVLEYEDKRYINYNTVDFRLTVEEKGSFTNYPLLIGIEK